MIHFIPLCCHLALAAFVIYSTVQYQQLFQQRSTTCNLHHHSGFFFAAPCMRWAWHCRSLKVTSMVWTKTPITTPISCKVMGSPAATMVMLMLGEPSADFFTYMPYLCSSVRMNESYEIVRWSQKVTSAPSSKDSWCSMEPSIPKTNNGLIYGSVGNWSNK